MAIVKNKDKNEPTERNIQNSIYHYGSNKQHKAIVPNIYLYSWESDMINLTRSGRVHEFEIKISRADFKADAKKTQRHEALMHSVCTPSEYIKRYIERARKDPETKHNREFLKKFTHRDMVICERPNFFWYVCPAGMITPEEVPVHAGLAYFEHGRVDTYRPPKKAPLLHKGKITEEQLKKISNSFMYRYWKLRLEK